MLYQTTLLPINGIVIYIWANQITIERYPRAWIESWVTYFNGNPPVFSGAQK
jgi:hypothetical protein